MNKDNVTHFLQIKSILDNVHGWCLPEALAAWDALLAFQQSKQITGNFLEIGVWRGKTAGLMLHHLQPAHEKLFLVDIKLVKDELKPTFELIKANHQHVVTYREAPSWGLEHVDFPSTAFRWIHIDGKHTGEAVYNDLKAADKFLSHDGVVCIDDFFEHQYPQIAQAVFRYLDRNPYSFAMFLCGFKKAYLARIEYVENYLSFCHQHLATEMEARGALATVSKTSYMADLNCFSMVSRYADLVLRGPDWDKKRIEVNSYVEVV